MRHAHRLDKAYAASKTQDAAPSTLTRKYLSTKEISTWRQPTALFPRKRLITYTHQKVAWMNTQQEGTSFSR